MMGKAAQTPGLVQVFSLFENQTPQVYLEIDRVKAELLGINLPDVFNTLQTTLDRPTSTTSICLVARSECRRRLQASIALIRRTY